MNLAASFSIVVWGRKDSEVLDLDACLANHLADSRASLGRVGLERRFRVRQMLLECNHRCVHGVELLVLVGEAALVVGEPHGVGVLLLNDREPRA